MNWGEVRDRIERRTDRVLADLQEDWGTTASVGEFEYGPKPWHPEEPPGSVEEQLDLWGGIASVVVCYTDRHEEAVLVYNRSGRWEPPGGVIEGETTARETAVREADEETGLNVEVTDLQYTGRVHLQYDDGQSVPLPLAQFVGHRVDGRLRVEREVNDHPGVTRGVGLFGPDVLPENCRDRDRILAVLDEN